ncbi:MAG: LysM peptidoglycan-binding domain-containing protein [Cytophagales bacterium]
MRFATFLLTILFIVFYANTEAKSLEIKDSIGMANIGGKPFLRYLVTPGETIYGISTKYKVPVTDLLELNPELENGLKVGQIINIPYNPQLFQSEKEENNGLVYHTVEPGETFYSLARKYGVSVGDLLKFNEIELKIGQKVVVGKKQSDANVASTAITSKEEPSNKVLKEEKKVTESSTVKVDVQKETVQDRKEEKIVIKNNTITKNIEEEVKIENVTYNNSVKRILVIPFDPYLYFSDADDEIAAISKMERTKVRQAFRKRLNALLEPTGFETIHLLGGRLKDSLTDLNRVYSSVTYSYQDVLYNPEAAQARVANEKGQLKEADKNKSTKPNDVSNPFGNSRASLAKDESKYFGVKVKDPNFFAYFNGKYKIDYYIFVNQFEVKTNYETCLDRSRQNYERNFITHFSIFDSSGKQIAGNRVKINYESNENRLQKILTDNMQKVADKIIAELPRQ